MSAVRLVLTVASAAVALSRNPTVRAGIRAVAANPQARETAINITRATAYNAGVIARHLLGPRRTP